MTSAAEDEVVELASQLIAIDTTNTGEPEGTVGEREAAEYVAGKLTEVGYEVEVLDSGAPGRSNVFCRLPGADRERGALLVHGHLDVVPAEPAEWSVHPFSGAVQDGYVWGRGAVDMKDMDAMMIAVARQFRRDGVVPPRDLVFAFLADEEAGGALGAQWLVEHRPDLFEGCTEAVGEVGGFSLTVNEQRMYLIEAAEKGLGWMRLRARGVPGHGSFLHDDNAVTKVAEAVARLGNHRFPLIVHDTVRQFLDRLGEVTGLEVPADDVEGGIAQARPARPDRRRDRPRHRQPDDAQGRLQGQRHPVDGGGGGRLPVPAGAGGGVPARGRRAAGPGRHARVGHAPAGGGDAVRGGSGGRDGRRAGGARPRGAHRAVHALGRHRRQVVRDSLGMRCYGFAPLRLPPELDFASLFHGIDERVPVDALKFGTRVLDEFLRTC